MRRRDHVQTQGSDSLPGPIRGLTFCSNSANKTDDDVSQHFLSKAAVCPICPFVNAAFANRFPSARNWRMAGKQVFSVPLIS
jgi:hypothetical protein